MSLEPLGFPARVKREIPLPPKWKGRSMITVQIAQTLINKHLVFGRTSVSDINQAAEITLNEPLIADRAYPPFHRVAMDGIAISFKAWKSGLKKFSIENCQRAGEAALTLKNNNNCIEVMTGSVLPIGTDCVIRYEDVTIRDQIANVNENLKIEEFQNIHQKGSDCKSGDELVASNTLMRSPQWAVAASIGKSEVLVKKSPKIALISTGDELVEVDQVPKDYQIRRSNIYSMISSLHSRGFMDLTLNHLPDSQEEILKTISQLLESHDILILTGGVSMGKFDFIPQCLADLKVKEVFHKVRQRPGKPFWFGVRDDKATVFGLPGNPTSSLICLHRYILPALSSAMGFDFSKKMGVPKAMLTQNVNFKKNLTYFLPVKLSYNDKGALTAEPVHTNGSGDFISLSRSDGFIELNEEQSVFNKGEYYPVYFWGRVYA